MAYEILAVKLCELEEQLSRLSGRIQLTETARKDQIQPEMEALARECAETELALQKKLQRSRAEMVATLSDGYERIGEILQETKAALQAQATKRGAPDDAVEEKILLAEYGLDFAVQAANRALLLAMEAIYAQLTQQEQERRPS